MKKYLKLRVQVKYFEMFFFVQHCVTTVSQEKFRHDFLSTQFTVPQGPVSLKGLSFGRKLFRLSHLVPKDTTAQTAFHKSVNRRCRSNLVRYFKHRQRTCIFIMVLRLVSIVVDRRIIVHVLPKKVFIRE